MKEMILVVVETAMVQDDPKKMKRKITRDVAFVSKPFLFFEKKKFFFQKSPYFIFYAKILEPLYSATIGSSGTGYFGCHVFLFK